MVSGTKKRSSKLSSELKSPLRVKKTSSDDAAISTKSTKSRTISSQPQHDSFKGKFISNALNKPRSIAKKASPLTQTKKSKIDKAPKTSSTKKSKLAPPSDSGESSENGDDDDEDAGDGESGDDDHSGEEQDEESNASEGEEEDAPLHGFSSDDGDSSDEDNDIDVEESGIDVGKLPTIAKDDATVKRKLEKAKRIPTEDKGVIYLGRLPHGFFEDQLKAYFSQFGDITRLRVSRNKRTGHSKHRAFLEFDSSSVAQIVAETMDNYLLMGHLLICKVIPKDKVHPELWVGANRKWRKVPTARVTREAHNKPRTEEEIERATKRLLKRQNEKKRKLAAAGINYNMDKVAYKKVRTTAS